MFSISLRGQRAPSMPQSPPTYEEHAPTRQDFTTLPISEHDVTIGEQPGSSHVYASRPFYKNPAMWNYAPNSFMMTTDKSGLFVNLSIYYKPPAQASQACYCIGS